MQDDTLPPVDDEDEIELEGYQDDLDTDDDIVDSATLDETDDPIETFGVPPEEYADELNGLAVDENDNDDIREAVEAADEGDPRE